jgi:hypothetical protein
LEQGFYGSHKVIGKDIHAKECRHSRISFRWKCGIPWRSTVESQIRISSFCNIIPKFEVLFGIEFKPIKTHMSEGYHAKTDDSPLFTEDDSAKYKSIVGCYICIWIIVLGRFDIVSATSVMSRFNMLPREGHIKVVKRIFSYLKTFLNGRVIIDTSHLDHYMYSVEDHSNRMEFYPDAGVKFQRIFLLKEGHAHDLVTRRSITEILVMLNNTPI